MHQNYKILAFLSDVAVVIFENLNIYNACNSGEQ